MNIDNETKQMITDLHRLFKPMLVSNTLKTKKKIKDLIPKTTADFILNHNKKLIKKKT